MHSVKLYKDSIYESLSSAGQTKHGSFEVLTQKMRGGLSDLVKDLFSTSGMPLFFDKWKLGKFTTTLQLSQQLQSGF